MNKRVLATVAAASCALALGACGSSDSSSSSSSGSSSGDLTAFCDKVKELKQLQNPFANIQPGDVQGAKDALDQVRSEIGGIDEVAPAEVKADVDKVKSTMDDFASKIADASTPAELAQAAQAFQGDALALQSSTSRLRAYTKKNCD